MGQVNGVQFCYEGICPHPRELDPGLVRVQGGYFGGGGQPYDGRTRFTALDVVDGDDGGESPPDDVGGDDALLDFGRS